MKKILKLGIISAVVVLAIGMILNRILQIVFPSLVSEYQNPSLFRPWSDPIMSVYFIYPFILGILLAWIWLKTKSLLEGKSNLKKGIYFGIAYWIVASIPGMVISYSSFQMSLLMILSWTFSGLIQAISAGLIFSHLDK